MILQVSGSPHQCTPLTIRIPARPRLQAALISLFIVPRCEVLVNSTLVNSMPRACIISMLDSESAELGEIHSAFHTGDNPFTRVIIYDRSFAGNQQHAALEK